MTRGRPAPDGDTPSRAGSLGWAGQPTGPTRLAGQVDRAGEGGCLHIEHEGTVYELVGDLEGLVVGQRASVTGRVDRTVQSRCGGGTPFVVTTATVTAARTR